MYFLFHLSLTLCTFLYHNKHHNRVFYSMTIIVVATNRYYVACFQLLLSLLVGLFYYNYKRLSTFYYYYSSRILSGIVFVTIVVTIYDHILNDFPPISDTATFWNQLFSQFELCRSCTVPQEMHTIKNDNNIYCCTRDLDRFIRFLIVIWSLILLLLLISKSSREKKLTLARSCEYAARKYRWDYDKLVELCVEFKYNYFPIESLEEFIATLKNPVQHSDMNDFIDYFRDDETEHTRNALLFNENNNEARKTYDEKIKVNEIAYRQGKRQNVIQRRERDTWQYEQYIEQKSLVTFHTHLPVVITGITAAATNHEKVVITENMNYMGDD